MNQKSLKVFIGKLGMTLVAFFKRKQVIRYSVTSFLFIFCFILYGHFGEHPEAQSERSVFSTYQFISRSDHAKQRRKAQQAYLAQKRLEARDTIVGAAKEGKKSKVIPTSHIYQWPRKNTEQTANLVAVGDNLIHTTIYEDARKKANGGEEDFDFSSIYTAVKPVIQTADLAYYNQESILGGKDLGYSGYPVFNTPDAVAQTMKEVGFNLVNGANNHALDQGTPGILHTIDLYKRLGQTFTGVYASQEDFDTIPVVESKGIRVAYLAYTELTNVGVGQPDAPYRIRYLEEEQVKKDVKQARKQADMVLVSVHWGNEDDFDVTPNQKKFAQLFNQLGVELVLGCHPHVIQPIEWLENRSGEKTLVVYSMGNFISGMLTTDNNLGYMMTLQLEKQADRKVHVTSPKAIPIVSYFEKEGKRDIIESRQNYKVVPLVDLDDRLAKRHALNGYEGQRITVDYYQKLYQTIVPDEFRVTLP